MSEPPIEFETTSKLDAHLRAGRPLAGCVFQGTLDLTSYTDRLLAEPLTGSVFLGCPLEPRALQHALATGATVFPRASGLPYEPYPSSLYTVQDLYDGYQAGVPGGYERSRDWLVYRHYVETGGPTPPSILESLHRRLHDHGITDALDEALGQRRVVAVMGGHRLSRDDPHYLAVARMARDLTASGYLLISGGGPGAMEATHLGAWFAGRALDELREATAMLAAAPVYTPIEPWLDTAFAVRARFPATEPALASIAVPTWHYGHEPTNVFAAAIAKYFANSERESGLLALARYGVIFAPGSAGTIQEIFQCTAQNHYARPPRFAAPMVLFGEGYWKWTKPVFPLLAQLAIGEPYGRLVAITDSVEEIVERIQAFRPPAL